MAKERAIGKVIVSIPLSVETISLCRRKFGVDGDTRVDYMTKAIEASVDGMRLTASELKECNAIRARQYKERMRRRAKEAMDKRSVP